IDDGGMPACSKASQANSSMTRCCGSICSASRGEMPKNPASKPATSPMEPAANVYEVPGSLLFGWSRESWVQRSEGTAETKSSPANKACHSASPLAPGMRNERPTTATGERSLLFVISPSVWGRAMRNCARRHVRKIVSKQPKFAAEKTSVPEKTFNKTPIPLARTLHECGDG